MYSSILSLTSALDGGWVGEWLTPAPFALRPPRYPLYKTGWAPGPVWTGVKKLVPPGFDPRTVQSVAPVS